MPNPAYVITMTVRLSDDLEDIADTELLKKQIVWFLRTQFEVLKIDSARAIKMETSQLTKGTK